MLELIPHSFLEIVHTSECDSGHFYKERLAYYKFSFVLFRVSEV